MRAPRRVTAIVALLAAASGAIGSTTTRKDALREWLDGPVHYIISPEEIKEFKSLKTDGDRSAFIERFWRRRDPSPETLVNEYREMFWKRVEEANEKFMDSSTPGWRTDRGKIYILYGPPEEVKEDPNADAGTDKDTDGHGLIRWVYLKPGGRKDVDPVVFVPFVRDVTGEYKLSYDPKLASPFFQWSQIEDNRTVGLGDFLRSIQPGSDPLSVMLDLGKMQEVPPQEKVILDTVDTVETFAFLPLPVAVDRFQTAAPGTLAVLTVGIPASEGHDPPSILARVTSGARSHVLGEGSFRIDGDGADRVAQARLQLEPGVWDATVLAVETISGVSRIYRGKVEPLGGSAGLHLSDTVVASAMEPLAYAAQASYDAPYIVGGFKVTPKPDPTIARGAPVQVFYEIYGGQPPYHLAYQLEGKEKDGRFVPLGRPIEHDGTERGQGFALPTAASWPAGVFRIDIAVTDAAGVKASAVAPFTVVAPAAP
jgi:GWxTD domain-containing protein